MATVFVVGDDVQLVGLVSNPSLNGAAGTVIGDSNYLSRGRYAINLKSPAAAVAAHPSGMSLKPINLMKVTECARPGCDQLGTKGCSACSKESYCSAECQKTDWKYHKPFCHLIKHMPVVLMPFRDVYSTVVKVLNQKEPLIAKIGMHRYIRLMQHAATFTKNQFGEHIERTSHYFRENGDSIDAWEVEIDILYQIYERLGYHDSSNRISYYQKSLAILESWVEQISVSEGNRIVVLTEKKIDYLYYKLSMTETNLSVSYKDVKDWDKAIHYQEQSILHAKLIKNGEKKIKNVYNSLSGLGYLYHYMGNLTESKAIREEAYMYVNATYDPEHPLVLEAGGKLIKILNATGEFYDAERFARVCYEGLTRVPLDPDSCEAAKAAINLANASCLLIEANGPESADIEEAEMLARKAVRIMMELKGPGISDMMYAFQALVNVIFTKKDLTDQTKSLLEDYLSDSIRHEGVDGVGTGCANKFIGRFHALIAESSSCPVLKRKHLQLAESYWKETSRIFMKSYGPNHPDALEVTSSLQIISRALGRIEN
jgi:tetratricopeptide (TPR) repeat protein